MVLILHGKSEHAEQEIRCFRMTRKSDVIICYCSRSNQMPYTDQITDIAPDVRTYFRVIPSNISTMKNALKYHGKFIEYEK